MSFGVMLVDSLIGSAIIIAHSRVWTRWETINWNKLVFWRTLAKSNLFILKESSDVENFTINTFQSFASKSK